MTKAELSARVAQLEAALALAKQDEEDANRRLMELEQRHLLVVFARDWMVTDATVIPPSGLMSAGMRVSLTGDDHVEMYTQVVKP